MPARTINHLLPDGHPWPQAPFTGWADFAEAGVWPARWVRLPGAEEPPQLVAYRLVLDLADAVTGLRLLVTADERYDLFLDGVRVGRGPERGDRANWYYDGYDLDLDPGRHVLIARVWSQGLFIAPWSHLGLRHGLLVASLDPAWRDRIATGHAAWQARRLDGCTWGQGMPGTAKAAWHVDELVDTAQVPWGWERGEGEGWMAVVHDAAQAARSRDGSRWIHHYEHALRPGRLPPGLSRLVRPARVAAVDAVGAAISVSTPFDVAAVAAGASVAALTTGGAVTVPARTTARILLDLGDYRCGYLRLRCHDGDGATLWAGIGEALHEPGKPQAKGRRDEVAGKVFSAPCARFRLDGGDREQGWLWWRAGRFLLLLIETADAPATLADLALEECGHPLADTGAFASDDVVLERLLPLCVRTLQACQHESFMDCPFYEQQLWVGDMRPQVLASYAMDVDAVLVGRCLEFLADTRWNNRLVQGRYPAPQDLAIPSFALWWVQMVADHALWRGEPAFVRQLLAAARGTLDWCLLHLDADGLARTPAGWDFVDWARGWTVGCPPGSQEHPSAVHNWLLAGTLARHAEVEAWLDEPELARRYRRHARAIAAAAARAFHDPAAGHLFDDPAHRHRSEHAAVLALLSGLAGPALRRDAARALRHGDGLVRCNLFFEHHLVEALGRLGDGAAIRARYAPYDTFAATGLCTTPETLDEPRSDCHAWSAHARFHAVATLAGIRPAGFGFSAVRIAPLLRGLTRCAATLPTPQGLVRMTAERRDGGWQAEISLPDGLPGELRWRGRRLPLGPGITNLHLAP